MSSMRVILIHPAVMALAYLFLLGILILGFKREIAQSCVDTASIIGCVYTFLLAKTAKDFLRNLKIMYKLLQWERNKTDIITNLRGYHVTISDEDGYDDDSRIQIQMQLQKLEHYKDAFDQKAQDAIVNLNSILSDDKYCKKCQELRETLAIIISHIELEQDFDKFFEIIIK